MPMPKGMTAPVLEGEALVYSTDAPNGAMFDKLPTWMQEKIVGRIIDPPKVAAKAAPAVPTPAGGEAFADDDLSF
jgi:hypothetical protein